jgi:hypothetical protein
MGENSPKPVTLMTNLNYLRIQDYGPKYTEKFTSLVFLCKFEDEIYPEKFWPKWSFAK